jgi:gluconolactonase
LIDDYMPAAISKDVIDGRILLYEEGKGVRVVAENIHFANECRLDANEEYLYVAQTCGRNVARFRVKLNGDFGDKEIFGPTDTGAFVDGIAFDSYGNLWGTHVMVDRIFALTPEGELRILLDDGRPGDIENVDRAFQAGEITADLLMDCGGIIARWIASITFAGDDLKTVYLGSLFGDRIAKFRSPVAGLAMTHWDEKYG